MCVGNEGFCNNSRQINHDHTVLGVVLDNAKSRTLSRSKLVVVPRTVCLVRFKPKFMLKSLIENPVFDWFFDLTAVTAVECAVRGMSTDLECGICTHDEPATNCTNPAEAKGQPTMRAVLTGVLSWTFVPRLRQHLIRFNSLPFANRLRRARYHRRLRFDEIGDQSPVCFLYQSAFFEYQLLPVFVCHVGCAKHVIRVQYRLRLCGFWRDRKTAFPVLPREHAPRPAVGYTC